MTVNPTSPTAHLSATFTHDGVLFRDLDHDGVLAAYEDWRLPSGVRVDDLLARMTIDEKVGLLFHGTAHANAPGLGHIGVGTAYDGPAVAELVTGRHVTSMISRLHLPASELAQQNNELQRIAASARLGIPVTVSTDPRHHGHAVVGAGVSDSSFSQWPGPLGLGAIGDADLVRHFGDVVRTEYRAVGMHVALSPQADLATSPRWPRADGTFGEDPHLVRRLVGAYVEGVQGGRGGLGPASVAAVVKHWVGYGASRDGYDGHNHYGRFSAFPGGRFEDHVMAFLDAFAAGVAGVMPTYNILEGLIQDGAPIEQVGAGFNRQLLLGLLRGRLGYQGLILSDWAITRDMSDSCRTGEPPQTPDLIAMPWGVEQLTKRNKLIRGLDAGLDQFGGEDDPRPLIEAVHAGEVSEARIDESARRVLRQKFDLGLFDAPFVDADAAALLVGVDEHRRAGAAAERRSVTQLVAGQAVLGAPDVSVRRTDRVYAPGMDAVAFELRGLTTVDNPADADVTILRVAAPHEQLHPGFFFGSRQHEGDLDWKEGDSFLGDLAAAAACERTIVVVHLDRAAVLSHVVLQCTELYAEYGIGDAALLDVLLGDAIPGGTLPLQLSRSMEAVLARPCDVPAGDPDPQFQLGFSARRGVPRAVQAD